MGSDLSRRLGKAVGSHVVTPQERQTIIDAAELVDTWDELPGKVRKLVEEIEARPGIWTPAAAKKATTRATVQRRFNPDEPRIPGGPHGGEWGHGGGGLVHDVLKLAGRIDLEPGESLMSSNRVDFNQYGGAAKIAVTELHGHRTIRLGLGGGDFAVDPWRAAPKGMTAKLTDAQAKELASGLDAAAKTAKSRQAAADKLWDATEAAAGTPGHAALLKSAQDAVAGDAVPVGVVSAEWGDVHYGYRVTDVDAEVAAAIRPTNAPNDWNLEDAATNDAGVVMSASEAAQLRKALTAATGGA